MTVLDLKLKLMERSSFQVNNMVVMFKGKILEDDKKLAAYGIEKEARLEQDTLTSYSDKLMKREAQMYQARFIDEQEKNQLMREDLTKFNQQIQTLTLQKSQGVSFGQTSDSSAAQIKEFNDKLQMMQLDLSNKVSQIEYFKLEKRYMQCKLDEFSKIKEDLTEKRNEVKELEREIQYLKDRSLSTQTDLLKELDQYKQKERENKELAKKIQAMVSQLQI